MTRRIFRVGTRGSGLALAQTNEALAALRKAHPDREFEVVTVVTRGDLSPQTALAALGRGAFVRELEAALLRNEVDLAVHSLKDLPTGQPEGVSIAAICRRHDPRDALVNRWRGSLEGLPSGARIGTSSPRRVALLKHLRPDVQALPIRGNVDTRVRKALGTEYDGAILAVAGLARLGLQDQIAQYLSPEVFVPEPGQGALAIEVRADVGEVSRIVSCLEHTETRAAVTAERACLELLGGGCQVPVAAYGRVQDSMLALIAMVATPDGARLITASVSGPASDPLGVARRAHAALVEQGAQDILSQLSAPQTNP